MSFQIISPECCNRSDVEKLVFYRNPNHSVHEEKAASRDPDGARSPQPGFWDGCVHFEHRHVVVGPTRDADVVQPVFIDLVTPTLHDLRNRLRGSTLKLGVYNPVTDLQAKLRALPPLIRMGLVEKAFTHFVALCSEFFQGPFIAWSHPDKIRMHFEVLALLYDPETSKKYSWAKLSDEQQKMLPWLNASKALLAELGVRDMAAEITFESDDLPTGRVDVFLSGGLAARGCAEFKVVTTLPTEPAAKHLLQAAGYASLVAAEYRDRRVWVALIYVCFDEGVRIFVHKGSHRLQSVARELLAA